MTRILLLFLFIANTYVLSSQVVINELDSDTPSFDELEFVELKSDTPFFSLNGYTLVFFNGNPTSSTANRAYHQIDLTGLTTDINGIILIGNTGVSPVPDAIFGNNLIENGQDAVVLYLAPLSAFPDGTLATSENVVDALVYGTNDPDATDLMTILGETVQINEALNNASATQSIQRKPDGTYEVKPPTPKANNDGSGFIFNGLTIVADISDKNEGESFTIQINSQTPVTTALSFSISLNSGNLENDDFTGNLSLTIPQGASTVSTQITLVDDMEDEGDEILRIRFGPLPQEYVRLNNDIEIRIIDNDFGVSGFGTPLNPTYGLVVPTTPLGYYDSLLGTSGTALRQALQNIIANPAVVREHNYGDVTNIITKADENPLNNNQVWLMYVEQPRSKLDFQNSGLNTGKWNREHIWPQSRGGFTDGTSDTPDGINVWETTNADDILAGHADAHHIRAEDGPENSIRNNRDYGLNDYNGPAGTQGSWRGDVARALFYMAVRYNGLQVVNGNLPDTTVGQIGDLATLLQWHQQDPPDDFEMNRNNFIYTWQQNRNPFIDIPALVNYIFGTQTQEVWNGVLSATPFTPKQSALLYPNPSTGEVYIAQATLFSEVKVFTTLGQLVSKFTIFDTSPYRITLDKGFYLVEIAHEGEKVIKKLLVQ